MNPNERRHETRWQGTIRTVQPDDLPAFRDLLRASDLPDAGLEAQFHDTFVVASEGRALLGGAGVEIHGSCGLLRSVVVSPRARGRGIGDALVAACIELAKNRHLEALYLLTETAEDYFPRFGFSSVPRREVPEAVRLSTEFASACPTTATVMRLSLRSAAR